MHGDLWQRSLDSYRYPVDLGKYPRRAEEGCPKTALLAGDRSATIQFEEWFRTNRSDSIEPWLTVAFWKLASQAGRATFNATRLERRLLEGKIAAEELDEALREFLAERAGALRQGLIAHPLAGAPLNMAMSATEARP